MSITMIGLDTAKSVFQIHAINESGKAELKRKLQRSELLAFFEKQAPCAVILEACGAAHHWARMLRGLGHDAKLIAPEAVKPFVKKGRKNDAVDAAALCTAGSQPDVQFVPMKSGEQQGILALHSARSLLVKQRTMLGNAMRGLASEFGLTVPKSIDKLGELKSQKFGLQANSKTREGDSHPDRDAQFAHINARVSRALADQQPVISVDTKKKELVGDFKNAGREWRPQGDPQEVRVHDFLQGAWPRGSLRRL